MIVSKSPTDWLSEVFVQYIIVIRGANHDGVVDRIWMWMWKGVQRKLQMCQSKNQVHYSV